ncbi:hypothetical protein [Natrinema gelatinilyticum]|uniref:hypothetical protein n=1 Tax=Natrinema gelatinilyticum TaxID=2961571 RepID=UPI0020C218E6|nr:hypothetical protein [Natrinema gelatinilyticum]
MTEQIDHECPTCEHMNYKIVDELDDFAGTTADVSESPTDGYRMLPVNCQRHGCEATYNLYLNP